MKLVSNQFLLLKDKKLVRSQRDFIQSWSINQLFCLLLNYCYFLFDTKCWQLLDFFFRNVGQQHCFDLIRKIKLFKIARLHLMTFLNIDKYKRHFRWKKSQENVKFFKNIIQKPWNKVIINRLFNYQDISYFNWL